MFAHQRFQHRAVLRRDSRCRHVITIEVLAECVFRVQHKRAASGHSGSEVGTNRAEHDDNSSGHVFAAVMPHTFDDCRRTTVAHREALARASGNEQAAAGRPVQRGIADQHIASALVGDRNQPAVHALADAVVCSPAEMQLGARQSKRAERLSGVAGQRQTKWLRQAGIARALRDRAH